MTADSNNFVEDDTEVASYAGCSKLDAALVLGGFLRQKAQHVRFVIHRDRDYLGTTSVTTFAERLARAGLSPFLTELNDIESYYINAEHLNSLNPSLSVDRITQLIAQATADTAAESVRAIVNQRTDEAFRERRDGGPTPDHGAIAVQAQTDYNRDPASMRRGTVVLVRLQALLQQELGANPRVFFPSQYLRSASLSGIATQIWPPTPVTTNHQLNTEEAT
jgi:hypothetical protein